MANLQSYVIGLLIFLLPLPFGGLLDWSKSVFILIVGLLALLIWIPRIINSGAIEPKEKAGLFLWLIFTTYIIFQIFPNPFLPEQIWCALCTQTMLDSEMLVPRISAYPLNTVMYWAMFSAYWIIVLMVTKLTLKNCYVLLLAIILVGLFQAIYGLLAFNKGQETIIGVWEKQRFFSSVTGTFYNKNHLAVMLALCLPIGTSYILNFSKQSYSGRRKLARRRTSGAFMTLAILFILCLGITILASDSRLGILSAIIGMLSYAFFRSRLSSKRMQLKEKISIIICFSLVIIVGIWIGIGSTVERFLATPDHLVDRTEVWVSIFKLPPVVWLFGIGAGSFEDVYKLVQPESQYFTYYRTHSEPLQFVLEFGIIGAGLITFFFVKFMQRAKAGFVKTDMGCAIFSSMLVVLFHSLFDFDFQVPGLALCFWVCFGLYLNPNLVFNENSRYSSSPA